jgi:hypothetical protein
MISKRAAAADAAADAKLSSAAESTAAVGATSPPPPAPPKKIDIGAVAAIAVACSAAGTALGYFLSFAMAIRPWQIPLIALGVMLVISGPAMIIAWMKLRKRNLGPIFDANGWAVNAKARINVPFGTSLTGIAKLPPGSTVDVSDRYAEKSAFLPKFLVFLFFAWCINSYLAEKGVYSYVYSYVYNNYPDHDSVVATPSADVVAPPSTNSPAPGAPAPAASVAPLGPLTTNAPAPAK